MIKTDLDTFLKFIDQTGEQKHFKCGQCGNRPGLLVTVTDRAADTSIDLRYECYKMYARAIERALKAEALARELVDMLERATPRYLAGRPELDLDLVHEVNGLLKKAKEVLGDD
jgi:hypothetical protein